MASTCSLDIRCTSRTRLNYFASFNRAVFLGTDCEDIRHFEEEQPSTSYTAIHRHDIRRISIWFRLHQTPIGEVVTEIRKILDPWLGQPKRKQGAGRFTLVYSFQSEDIPSIPMKLKIEINTREHFSVKGFIHKDFKTNSRWFQGNARILTYHLEELMGTKLRALVSTKKRVVTYLISGSF